MGGREDTQADTSRRSGRVAPFRRVFSWILSPIFVYGVGAVLDFLVEDACVLCGGSRSRTPPTSAGVDGPAGFLLEPVRSPWAWGTMRITNHPVCVDCAVGFDATQTVGTIGTLIRPNSIETASGERFGAIAAPEVDGDQSAGPDEAGPVERISVVAPFMINDNLLKLVHLMKFGGYVALARPIGRAIGCAVRDYGVDTGTRRVVVPVPMDAAARTRRGFNQAERIARELGADLGIPVSANLLTKMAPTRRQSKTKHELRAENVRGAFGCPRNVGDGPAGKHVFLVDDLVTTGATAAACAAELYGAGADAVTVLSFGRAL